MSQPLRIRLAFAAHAHKPLRKPAAVPARYYRSRDVLMAVAAPVLALAVAALVATAIYLQVIRAIAYVAVQCVRAKEAA